MSPPYERICQNCGKAFMAGRPNAKFCGHNCQEKYYRHKAAQARKRDCTCENCGTVFTTSRKGVKYCSDACRVEANRRMQKQRNAKKRNTPDSLETNEKTA